MAITKLSGAQLERAGNLFDGWDESFIKSCLSGYMGAAYTDDVDTLASAQIFVADFALLAGKPSVELAAHIPSDFTNPALIIIPQNEAWCEAIDAAYGGRAVREERYAIKKEPEVFDIQALTNIVGTLPDGLTLKNIDRELFRRVTMEKWSQEFCCHYESYEQFDRIAAGVVVLDGEEIVAGASSYTAFPGGIEVEIDTRPDHHRMGLATICGAALIIECTKRHLYPSWDAISMASVALAEKLGYHFDREYTSYYLETINQNMEAGNLSV